MFHFKRRYQIGALTVEEVQPLFVLWAMILIDAGEICDVTATPLNVLCNSATRPLLFRIALEWETGVHFCLVPGY